MMMTSLLSRTLSRKLRSNLLRRQSSATSTAPVLVVFDKDGTLIDFHGMWGPWAERQVNAIMDQAMEGSTTEACDAFRQEFYDLMDYDPSTGKIGARGYLACNTFGEISEATAALVAKHVEQTDAQLRPMIDSIQSSNEPDPIGECFPLADFKELFATLNSMGAQVAVCTTDDRAPTIASLEHMGVLDMVVGISCGDDGLPSKPAKEQIEYLQQEAGGVSSTRTVMVGDTPKDMQLGTNAECILKVGLIGGASSIDDLSVNADFLITDLSQLPKMVEMVTHLD